MSNRTNVTLIALLVGALTLGPVAANAQESSIENLRFQNDRTIEQLFVVPADQLPQDSRKGIEVPPAAKAPPDLAVTLAAAKAELAEVYDEIVYRDIRCHYVENDQGNWGSVEFNFVGNLTVINEKEGFLSFAATLELEEEFGFLVFGRADNIRNGPYNSKKYKNHFKFHLNLNGVGYKNQIEYAYLIISKDPVKIEVTDYRRQRMVFSAVLDVSYNDHHGDYVPLRCTSIVR